MIDLFKNEINFLKSSWQNLLGRPTVVIVIKKLHYGTYYLNDFTLMCFRVITKMINYINKMCL